MTGVVAPHICRYSAAASLTLVSVFAGCCFNLEKLLYQVGIYAGAMPDATASQVKLLTTAENLKAITISDGFESFCNLL